MHIGYIKSKIKSILCNRNTRCSSDELSYNQAMKYIKTNPETVLLDVRSQQEYREGHLKGSINIPLYELLVKAKIELPNKNIPIIVYCQTGHRSRKALDILKKEEYENLYTIKGGLDEI